jgi:hypothetical protein
VLNIENHYVLKDDPLLSSGKNWRDAYCVESGRPDPAVSDPQIVLDFIHLLF